MCVPSLSFPLDGSPSADRRFGGEKCALRPAKRGNSQNAGQEQQQQEEEEGAQSSFRARQERTDFACLLWFCLVFRLTSNKQQQQHRPKGPSIIGLRCRYTQHYFNTRDVRVNEWIPFKREKIIEYRIDTKHSIEWWTAEVFFLRGAGNKHRRLK